MSKHLEDKNLIARWMDGRLSEAEKKQMEESGELDALKSVIDDIDTWTVKPFDTEAGLQALNNKKSTVIPLNKTKNRSWLAIAASIALLVCSSLIWMLANNSETAVSTTIAETKTIELPQGSLVELDAVSTLTFNKKDWEKTRSLSLVGQAYFDVTSGVPFEVNTPIAKVEVLGTQFNIKTEKERFSVECFEGKIQVTFKGNTKIITKGQRVLIENGALLKLEHQKNNPEWLKGLSNYNKTPLKEVIADVQRYYNVDITLPKKYQTFLFTGSFQHSDLKGALHTIFTTMEIKYRLTKDDKVIFE